MKAPRLLKRSLFWRSVAAAIIGVSVLSPAHAGYVANDATIQKIVNTSGNQTLFAILVTGGTGPCLGQWISFPVWAAPDADTHKRAYAAALMAFAMGAKVQIHNYLDNSCTAASYIEVSKP